MNSVIEDLVRYLEEQSKDYADHNDRSSIEYHNHYWDWIHAIKTAQGESDFDKQKIMKLKAQLSGMREALANGIVVNIIPKEEYVVSGSTPVEAFENFKHGSSAFGSTSAKDCGLTAPDCVAKGRCEGHE